MLLYALHTSALVCLLWLDRGHKIHCKLAAQLISCIRTTVTTSVFLEATFERILLNNVLHLVSGRIPVCTSSTLEHIWTDSSQWRTLHTRCWVCPTKSPYKQFQGCSFEGFLYLETWQDADTQLSLDPTFKPSRIQSPSSHGTETPASTGVLRQKTNSCTLCLILMQLARGNSPNLFTLLSHHVEEPISKTH